jgi:hypothetical protein
MHTHTAAKIRIPLPSFAPARWQAAGMASESYTVRQAASLLNITERRVRQMAAAGALPIVAEHPTRLEALAVIEERKRRAAAPAEAPTPVPADPDYLRSLVVAIVGEILPRALEGRDRVEEILREDLAAARAEAAQLRAELDEAKAAKPWKRKKKKGKK